MLSESEMIDHLKQDLIYANQALEAAEELLRSFYSSGELSPEAEEAIEDIFQQLDWDL